MLMWGGIQSWRPFSRSAGLYSRVLVRVLADLCMSKPRADRGRFANLARMNNLKTAPEQHNRTNMHSQPAGTCNLQEPATALLQLRDNLLLARRLDDHAARLAVRDAPLLLAVVRLRDGPPQLGRLSRQRS
jgi:hypothetical protein